MKGIFFLLLILIIDFSYELTPTKCGPDEVRLCGCFSCFCRKKPKCLEGQKVECRPGPFPRCFCVKEEKKNAN